MRSQPGRQNPGRMSHSNIRGAQSAPAVCYSTAIATVKIIQQQERGLDGVAEWLVICILCFFKVLSQTCKLILYTTETGSAWSMAWSGEAYLAVARE